MQVGDEQIYASDKEPVKLEMKLQCQLLEADQWFGTNGMITNPGKYQAMVLGNTNYTFSFTVNDTNVPVKDNIDRSEQCLCLHLGRKYARIRYALLRLINYSCGSYSTRASYSDQVDEFRNPVKNELKTRPCFKPVFEIISNTDANFFNLHIDKATKTRGDKQLFNHKFYETNFKPKLFTANVE